MVVRIHKLLLSEADTGAPWPGNEYTGALRYVWPNETHLYQLTILEEDEASRPLRGAFRQQQLRKLVPAAVEAVREMSDHLVVRLDGQLAIGELSAALTRIAMGDELIRFGVSPIRRLEAQAGRAYASVRAVMTARLLAALCVDDALGLDRSVRLRIFAVSEALVAAVLDIDTVEDERWSEILPQCGFVLGSTPGLASLQIFMARLDTRAIKSRLTQRLLRPATRPLRPECW